MRGVGSGSFGSFFACFASVGRFVCKRWHRTVRFFLIDRVVH